MIEVLMKKEIEILNLNKCYNILVHKCCDLLGIIFLYNLICFAFLYISPTSNFGPYTKLLMITFSMNNTNQELKYFEIYIFFYYIIIK